MTPDRLLVTIAAILLSAWVLWYFLAPPKPAVAPGRRAVRAPATDEQVDA